MIETAHLWLFFLMVLGVVLLPGLDMAYVMASSLVGGQRSGLLATAGVIAGGACHVLLGALGVLVVLKLVPAAFNLMLVAGALYIAWIGWSLLRSRVAFGASPSTRVRSGAATFGKGMATCLLNPKAYLFMLAVFPQFLKPEYGPLWLQALALWVIIATCQAAVYGGMALAGDRVKAWLGSKPATDLLLARLVGLMLIAAAAFTAWEGWHLS